MTREIDEPIPGNEVLYRALHPRDVEHGRVVPASIDLARCSVQRSKYTEPVVPVVQEKPEHTGIGTITPDDLPPVQVCNGVSYEFVACDEPSQGIAHAEIHVARIHPLPRKVNVPSGAKQTFKALIAKKIQIHTTPK